MKTPQMSSSMGMDKQIHGMKCYWWTEEGEEEEGEEDEEDEEEEKELEQTTVPWISSALC